MFKLSTTSPKQLMNPPMWIMPKAPALSTGVVAWIEGSLFWIEELFTKKQSKTNVVCGTMLVYSGKLKFTGEFIKEHGLDEDYQSSTDNNLFNEQVKTVRLR